MFTISAPQKCPLPGSLKPATLGRGRLLEINIWPDGPIMLLS